MTLKRKRILISKKTPKTKQKQTKKQQQQTKAEKNSGGHIKLYI